MGETSADLEALREENRNHKLQLRHIENKYYLLVQEQIELNKSCYDVLIKAWAQIRKQRKIITHLRKEKHENTQGRRRLSVIRENTEE